MSTRSIFHTLIRDGNGAIKHFGAYRPNLRTTDGLNAQAAQMGHVGSQPAAFGWIALTADSATPNVADTTLASEITSGGLSRAAATYAHTGGVASFTESVTFTATGSFTVNKEALFNAVGPPVAGTMGFESLEPSPPSVVATDTISQVITISL